MMLRKIEPRDIMRYYVAYQDIEKNIIDSVLSEDQLQKQRAFHKYINNYMSVGRNFKSGTAVMILTTIENMLLNEGNLGVEELSERMVRNELVSRQEIKNLKVAASKLLWLYDRETIIMDNYNKTLLKAKDYGDYVQKWKVLFDSKLSEINQVTNQVFKGSDDLVNELWFKMRVFDLYLQSIYFERTQ